MLKKQHLLLIGCGDLPSRLIKKLDLSQWHISGLRRSEIALSDVRMTYGDATDPQIIESLISKQPNQIIICLTPDSRDVEAYINTYLRTAELVSRSAQKLAPQCHLIFISSTSVYGQNSGQEVNESSPTQPNRESAQILLQAEKEIIASNNPYSIIRFSGIYGPGRERLIHKVRSGKFANSNEASWTNRIHSEDCTLVMAHLLNQFSESKSGSGILIGSDMQPVLNTEVESWLARELNVSAPISAPSLSPSGKRCSNTKLLNSGYLFTYPNYQSGYSAVMQNL